MKHILIVDDKEDNLYYLNALLTGHDYTVEAAHHGAEALFKARQRPPDLVISDLLMPVMDGYTLLRHWKVDARLRQVPFIVYTATYTEAEDERLALDLGADAFILKPAEPEDLLARIRMVQVNTAAGVPVEVKKPVGPESELLKVYNETLIRKLEEKTLQLEETNRALQQDISERKLTETALRASEERFRQLAENIHEVFWMTDPAKNEMLYISPAYEKIWGRTCSSLLESPASWLDSIHSDDRAGVIAALPKQASGDYDEIYRILRPDGVTRWIHDRAFPVREADGQLRRIVGIAEDVTKRREMEERTLQAQKMEAIGTLAGGIAHDFNNILVAIIGFTELARFRVENDPLTDEYLASVLQGGNRAADLVRQILTFSRTKEQKLQPARLDQVVAEPLKLLRATIPASIAFDLSLAADLPSVMADATQIHQIVMNLCTNASHAMGGRPGRLTVRLENFTVDMAFASANSGLRPGPHVRLTVSDTGCGMDQATQARIFEPFFTTKGPGEGTGLGLSVVHGIVQSHGGAITVESHPGEGTVFRMYFPALAPAPAAAPSSTAPTVAGGKGERILFVDDEKPLAMLGKMMLTHLGYRPEGYSDPIEALAAVRADPRRFDLILTDLAMPGMTGMDLARQIHELRPDLPIILATGFLGGLTHAEMRAQGIREHLPKPYAVLTTSTTIRRVLDASAPRRQAGIQNSG